MTIARNYLLAGTSSFGKIRADVGSVSVSPTLKREEVRRMKSMFRIAISATLVVSAAISTLPFFDGDQSSETPIAQAAREVRFERQTKVEIVTNSHVIASGETLSSISRGLLGDMELFRLLYEQNSASIESAAISRGLESSEAGHWIFPGETLSISIPVVTEELLEVEVSQEETEQTESTETPAPTETVTATATVVAETATSTPAATETVTEEPTATSTAVDTATATPTETPTATATATPNHIATVEPTPIVFPFSPSWPLRPESGGTFGISSYFGTSHPLGIDIDACGGCGGYPVFPIEDGLVVFSGWDAGSGYGNAVVIEHRNGLVSRYAHLETAPSVFVGQQVSQCQSIGYMGSTGYSTGPHLHLEILSEGVRQNPLNYLKVEQLNESGPDCSAKIAAALVELDRLRREKEHAEFVLALQQVHAVQQIATWNAAVEKAHQKQMEELLITRFLLFPWFGREVQVIVPTAIQAQPTPELASTRFAQGKEVYLPFLTQVAHQYGADLERIVTVMDRCENHGWDPYANEPDDGGSPTIGLARFKESTYKSNARAMGLSAAEIEDWTNPFNQLRVMTWMYADGSAGAWSGYRYLYMEGRPWLCAY